ncbi:hypothetical protein TNCV_3485151 [Trichonephila clavipes]|nr:hypothetical protein TNCV_3485151 [Trichonephila clavipes]
MIGIHIFNEGKFNKKCSLCFKKFLNARRFKEHTHREHHRDDNIKRRSCRKSPSSGCFGGIIKRYSKLKLIPKEAHELFPASGKGTGKVDVGVNTNEDVVKDKFELSESKTRCIFYSYTNNCNNHITEDEMFKDLKSLRSTLMWMKDQDLHNFRSDSESGRDEKNTQNLVAIENRTTENKGVQVDTCKNPKELNMCILYLHRNILQKHCALLHVDIKMATRATLEEYIRLFMQLELLIASHEYKSCPPFMPNAKKKRAMLLRKVSERVVDVENLTYNFLKYIIENKLHGWDEPEFLSFKVLPFSKLED